MKPEHPHRELSVELRALQSDYHGMMLLAREIEARGYHALLASTEYAGRARELRDRAVRLFNRVARTLQHMEEARDVRVNLLRTSERLASLFPDNASAARAGPGGDPHAQPHGPTLKELLDAMGGGSMSCDGMSLHDRVLSVADAADNALHAWRPPSR